MPVYASLGKNRKFGVAGQFSVSALIRAWNSNWTENASRRVGTDLCTQPQPKDQIENAEKGYHDKAAQCGLFKLWESSLLPGDHPNQGHAGTYQAG